MNDLSSNPLLILQGLKVINEPLNHFLVQYWRKHLCGQLMQPLRILTERFPIFLFCSLKDCTIKSYLSIELVMLQKGIGHLPLARGLLQSHIPCGCRAS